MTESDVESLTAVVADDDAVTRRLLSALIQRQGFAISVASDGPTALALVRQHHPEVVFLDAHMPGLTGYDVCRAIRNELDPSRQPYIIMVTAAGQDADRARAIQAGVDEFLTKPFSPSQLASRLGSLTASHRASEQE